MTVFKKVASLVMATAIIASMSVAPASAKTVTEYGFKYDNSYVKADFRTGRYVNTYSGGACIGKMHYTLGRLRSNYKNSNGTYQDTLLVRMIMDPQKNVTVNGIKNWGVSEWCRVNAHMPTSSINNWAPQNQPKTSTWTVGLDYGGKGNSSVSASTNVTVKQLEFDADVGISDRRFNMVYDYKPSKTLSWSKTANSYCRNSSIQYAMISFNGNSYIAIRFDFNANFTMSENKYATPGSVDFGSNKGKATYSWYI